MGEFDTYFSQQNPYIDGEAKSLGRWPINAATIVLRNLYNYHVASEQARTEKELVLMRPDFSVVPTDTELEENLFALETFVEKEDSIFGSALAIPKPHPRKGVLQEAVFFGGIDLRQEAPDTFVESPKHIVLRTAQDTKSKREQATELSEKLDIEDLERIRNMLDKGLLSIGGHVQPKNPEVIAKLMNVHMQTLSKLFPGRALRQLNSQPSQESTQRNIYQPGINIEQRARIAFRKHSKREIGKFAVSLLHDSRDNEGTLYYVRLHGYRENRKDPSLERVQVLAEQGSKVLPEIDFRPGIDDGPEELRDIDTDVDGVLDAIAHGTEIEDVLFDVVWDYREEFRLQSRKDEK